MAISIGSIIASLQLNIDNFAANLQKAEQHIKGVEQQFNGFADIGGRLTSVGTSMTLGVTAPVIGLGTAIASTSASFQAGMSKVQAISGATGEDLQKLKAKAMEMGQVTQFSATEAADAMSYMAMAGWDADKIMGGLSGVMDLAAASGEDLASVSDIVTDAMTAFGLEADKAGSFADVLASASSNANTNVALLGESFKYVAPVAGALGYSAEDTAIALGMMANAGIKGSQGGTALRASLTRMVDPTKEVAGLMKEYGISMTDADGNMNSLGDMMGILREKLGGLDEATQAQVASTLFGQEAMSGMLAIVNGSDADFDKLTDAIYGSDGAAKTMAETMNDNVVGKLKLLWSQLETVALKLGESLLPIIEEVVVKITEWVDWFSNLSSETQQTVMMVAVLAAAVGPLLVVVGSAIKTFGTMQKNLRLVRDGMTALKNSQMLAAAKTNILAGAQAALNAIMSLNPVFFIIAGIVALVAAFVILWNKCEGFRNFWIKLWDKIKECAKKVWDWLEGAGQAVIDYLLGAWQSFRDWWDPLWEGLKKIPGELWDWIVSSAMSIWDSVKQGWQNMCDGINAVWQSICDTVKEFMQFIIDRVTDGVEWIADKFSGTFEAIQGILEGFSQFCSGIWEVIKNVIGGAVLLILDLVVGDFEQLREDAINIWNNILQGLSDVWEGIWTMISEYLNYIVSFLSEIWTVISETIMTVWNAILEFLTKLWDNISEYCQQKWTEMGDYISTTIENIRQWIHEKWEEIKKNFFETLENIKTNVKQGWQWILDKTTEIITNVKTWLVDTWNSILAWFRELPAKLKKIGEDMFNRMRDGIVNTVDKVKEATVKGVTKAIDWLKDLPRQAITWGQHMIEGFINGITAKAQALVDKVKGVAQSVRDYLGFTVPKKGPLHVYMEWMPHMMEGMRDSLNGHKFKLLDAAQDVAGDLSNAINDPILNPQSDSTEQKRESRKKNDDEPNVQYNIHIERMDANSPDDVRKLAEGLEAIKRRDEL